MKKFVSGFTLAEVLITLGIIGVIAAIVMPSVMTNYTYKTIGVKISKFTAQLEGATRPYVAQNTNFENAGDVTSFARESFLIKNIKEIGTEKIDCSGVNKDFRCGNNSGKEVDVLKSIVSANMPANILTTQTLGDLIGGQELILKDGTSLITYMLSKNYDEDDEIDTYQVGEAVFGIAFNPNVQGLPRSVQKNYQFVITELGYVYPDRVNDTCMGEIYDAEFITTSKNFSEGSNCVIKSN